MPSKTVRNTMFEYEMLNIGCGNVLTLTLEWDPRTMSFGMNNGTNVFIGYRANRCDTPLARIGKHSDAPFHDVDPFIETF